MRGISRLHLPFLFLPSWQGRMSQMIESCWSRRDVVETLNLGTALNLAKGSWDMNPKGHHPAPSSSLSHACKADDEDWRHVRPTVYLGSKPFFSKTRDITHSLLSSLFPC